MKKFIVFIMILLIPMNAHASFSECAFGDCVRSNSTIFYPDNKYAAFGGTSSSPNLLIYFNGTDGIIKSTNTTTGSGRKLFLEGGNTTDIESGGNGAVIIGLSTVYTGTTVKASTSLVDNNDLAVGGDIKIYGASQFVGNTETNGTLTSTNTSDIGWTPKSGTNTACNTTCTNACVFGFNVTAGNVTGLPLLCTDATADVCICAGGT